MLSLLLNGNYTTVDIVIQIFALLVILLVAFPIHECAHGLVAKLLGDNTADEQGRLTLNPISHLDPIGAIGMFLVGIGWAKPVPVNPTRCRKIKSAKNAMALIAAAGPLANVLLSFIFMIVMKIVVSANGGMMIAGLPLTPDGTIFYVTAALYNIIKINIFLTIFNLLPIPPFDGSRILFAFLPTKYYFKIMKYEQFIMIAVLVILCTRVLDKPLDFLADGLYGFLDMCTGFVG